MTGPEREIGRIDKLLTPRERKPILTIEFAEQVRDVTRDFPDDMLALPLYERGSSRKERPAVWNAYLNSLSPTVRSVLIRAFSYTARALREYTEGRIHDYSVPSPITVGDFRRLKEMVEENEEGLSFLNSPSAAFVAAAFHRPGVEEVWPRREKYVPDPSENWWSYSRRDDVDEDESLGELGRALRDALAEENDDDVVNILGR